MLQILPDKTSTYWINSILAVWGWVDSYFLWFVHQSSPACFCENLAKVLGKKVNSTPPLRKRRAGIPWKESRSWPDHTTLVSRGIGQLLSDFEAFEGLAFSSVSPGQGPLQYALQRISFLPTSSSYKQKLVGDTLYKHMSRIKINSFLFLRKISMMYKHFSSHQGQVPPL